MNDKPVLVIGATGHLGRAVVANLLQSGHTVRAATRDPEQAGDLADGGVEIVRADLTDRVSMERACLGVGSVIAAAHALTGRGKNGTQAVDDQGHRRLIDVVREAGVEHLVYVSTSISTPDYPVDFFRIKYATEERVRASGLSYTVVRGAAFMESNVTYVGQGLFSGGKAMIAGRGDVPSNYVSVRDVAHFIALALSEPGLKNRTVEVGGPAELTLNDVIDVYEGVIGRPIKRTQVPIPVLRIMAAMIGIVHPGQGRLLRLVAESGRRGFAVDMAPLLSEYPHDLTTFEQVIAESFARQ